jgi:hypothetical protein
MAVTVMGTVRAAALLLPWNRPGPACQGAAPWVRLAWAVMPSLDRPVAILQWQRHCIDCRSSCGNPVPVRCVPVCRRIPEPLSTLTPQESERVYQLCSIRLPPFVSRQNSHVTAPSLVKVRSGTV